MNDHDFDALAREALARDAEAFPHDGLPSEAVWRQVRPEPKWLPSFKEISLATAIGGAVLFYLSFTPTPRYPEALATRPHPTPHKRPTIDQTYVAISTTTFP